MAYPAPGLSLTFDRAFQSSIVGRYTDGRLGRGWVDNWDYSASLDTTSNQVTIEEGVATRTFTANADGAFKASAGDTGILTEVAGAYHLAEADGSAVDFNKDGTLDYVQDASGNRITAGYTGGALTTLTASDGDALTIAYNAQGKIASVVDPSGRVATYAYDSTGQMLTSVTTAAGSSTYAYGTDTTGPTAFELASIGDPGGTHVDFGYDSQGQLATEQGDGGTGKLTYSYGVDSYTVTDAAGNATTSIFDQTGATVATVDALGHISTSSHDGIGQVTSLGEVGGGASTISYGTTKTGASTTTTTDPTGGKTSLTYTSGYGELTASTDQDGNVTAYGRDAAGRLTSITYADGTKATNSYAADGEVTQSVARNGVKSNDTYDSRGLLLSQTLSDGTTSSYTYDAHGNMLTATDASGTLTMVYDSADRLTKITYPDGRFLAYTYDAGGRRTSSTDQDGLTTDYSYDGSGRLAETTDGTGALIAKYSYDSVGNLVRQDNGNGTYTIKSYDAVGDVLGIVNYAPDSSVNSRFDYTYDALGRVATMATPAGTATYSYDADSRLTGAKLADGTTIDYRYDAAGNRTVVVTNGVATTYTANDLNEYVTVGGTVQAYDAAGDLTSGDGDNYTYDDLGRLASVTNASGTYTYTYDALGNRSSETHNGVTTSFLVDPTGLGNVVAEYDGSGNLLASYTYGNGLTSQVTSSGAAYYDFDAVGSTAGLSDASGKYVASYSYDPFGKVLSSMGSVTNPFQYNGALGIQTDGSGLDYMRARTYDPTTGRFTQSDPIGGGGGFNTYSFTGNDVTNLVDPSGLVPQAIKTLGSVAGTLFGYGTTINSAIGLGQDVYDVAGSGRQNESSGVGDAILSLGGGLFTDALVKSAVDSGLTRQIGAEVGATLIELSTGLAEAGVSINLTLGAEALLSIGSLPITLLGTIIVSEYSYVIEGLFEAGAYFLNLEPVEQGSTTDVVGGSHDPNSISGPAGYGVGQFITDAGANPYFLSFTNEADADTPARTVTVTEQLDPNLDLSTFQLGAFGFGDQVVNVPAGVQNYETRVDDRAGTGVFVDVSIHLDTTTGTLTATYTSIDPSTLDVDNVVGTGFLPPDKSEPEGTGFLTYTVAPKPGLASGTPIAAKASVVFDTNAPVVTNAFVNTIDNAAPTSSVAALPAVSASPAIALTWSGSDGAGSGIASYSIYVSTDGGAYVPLLQNTTDTQTTFEGVIGHSYSFYSIATDNVGFVESPPSLPEATTLVDTAPVASAVTGADTSKGGPITLAAAYSDPDAGDSHSFAINTAGAKGMVTNNGNGTFTYNPNGAFNTLTLGQKATDSFTYTVTDAAGLSSTATATVTITGQDTAPVASAVTGADTSKGGPITLAAAYSDPDAGDSHSFAINTAGAKGMVTNNGNGTFTYNPNGAFNTLTLGQKAIDSFTYTVTDAAGLSSTATATVTITGQDTAPVATKDGPYSVTENSTFTVTTATGVLVNDSDADGQSIKAVLVNGPAHGTLALAADGSFSYKPAAGFVGTDSFAYQASDGTLASTPVSVTLDVEPAKLDTLTLRVAADNYKGSPQFIVKVDGVQVGGVQTATAAYALGQFQDITLTGNFGLDPKTVTVTYLNDAYEGTLTTDRNLIVESMTLDGKTFLGAAATNPVGAANGGATILYANGAITFSVQPAKLDTLTLRVAADNYKGSPQFIVKVDGVQVGGVQTATAAYALGQFQDITLTGNFGLDPKTVTVTYLNDAYEGTLTTDRNLIVESMTLDGKTFLGAAATNPVGAANGGATILYANGAITFSVQPAKLDTLTLRVAADNYKGSPQFIVKVDGVQVGGVQTATAAYALGQFQDITLTGNFGPDPKTVTVTYLNDAYEGTLTTDRNLIVESMTLDGKTFLGAAATNPVGAANGGATILYANGAITFSVQPAKLDTLTLRVAADNYKGSPQFIVKVDGVQVGGVQTATAAYALGQFQDITLTGNFGLDPKTVTVTYLNDAYEGTLTTDRNLIVESMTLDGKTFLGAAATNPVGAANGGATILYANGAITFSVQPAKLDTLTLRVAADNYKGSPQFIVKVDGVQVGGVQTATAAYALGQFQDITLTGNFGLDPKTVTVTYLNDAYEGTLTTDRNLIVESMTLDGKTFLGAAATNPVGSRRGSDAILYSNGSITFNLGSLKSRPAEPPVCQPPLQIAAALQAEDFWLGIKATSTEAWQTAFVSQVQSANPDVKRIMVSLR